MPQIFIPETLFKEIEKALPQSASADDFVLQAVRDKLTFVEHKQEFLQLSESTRAAMRDKGLSEADILTDFECFRNNLNG